MHTTRTEVAIVAAISVALLLGLFLATHLDDFALFSAMPLAFLVQCGQRIEVGPGYVRRVGLRPVRLDLDTAVVTQTGRAWWVELCFLGRSLELRDEHGHRLRLESWLWSRATRDAICALVPARTPAVWTPPVNVWFANAAESDVRSSHS